MCLLVVLQVPSLVIQLKWAQPVHAEAEQTSALTLAAGKSSIGHTEPAAGMAGVLHALQALQSQSVDAILHFRQVIAQ